jgi:nucleoside-diphosphate-sugar epimerase
MQKILITGYTGFIGSNITQYLSDNTLYGVDIVQKDSVAKHFNRETLNECLDNECIIHLAGKAHDTKNTAVEQEYFDINVGLTQKIFQHFLTSSATKFIFFSSVKAVADSVTGEYLNEESIPNPQTPYGKSKLEAEEYILSEWEKWRKSEGERERKGEGANSDGTTALQHEGKIEQDHVDKKVYILRPCMIHGPGNKGNLNLLYKIQQKGLPWPLGAFENKRSFCSIDNLLFVIKQIIEKNIEPGVYQVADDDAISTNELITIMAGSQNKKASIWNIPANLIETIARIGGFLHFPLNGERLKKLTESYVVSNRKIKKALGIEKMPVTAAEGLRRTFESFRK